MMQKKLFLPRQFAAILLFAAAVVAAHGAADTKKKAIRREMIEMDIAVRNLTSIIALGDRKMLDDSLQRLSTWQMKDHPDLGAAFREVLGLWQGKGLLRYGTELQKEAQAMRAYANARNKLSDADWTRLNGGMGKILLNCQNCHEAARKEAQ